jgi:Peptidase family M23/Transglycosylase SLT domain/NlpC/P60 family
VLLVAPLLATLMLGPLLIALIVAGIVAPAAISTMACQEDPPIAAAGQWRPPFQQRYTLTSPFGRRLHPIYKEWRLHTGQDLASVPGAAPVVAAAAGTVLSVGTRGAYGNMVTLRHPGSITTRYGHLASIDRKIRAGAVVAIGQRLGVEGSTGASTGLHLHFQVEINGRPVDPEPFMASRGAPLNGTPVAASSKPPSLDTVPFRHEAPRRGVGFALPPPGRLRQNSLHNPPLAIPHKIKNLYVAAAGKYDIPWTLLAGIGMEETGHGRNNHTSSAGAQGLMQFMPGTWASMGVDGDSDGRADIHNDADSIYSAANYLTRSGVRAGAAGVRRALFAYNPIDWYVNDVLYYATRYGSGNVSDDTNDCGPGAGNRNLPPLTGYGVAKVLTSAKSHDGDSYRMGAAGPHTWDCSSFTQASYAQIGVKMPRTATAQRNWLATGNGTRIQPGQERPGDLIFWDSYRGPNRIGHVMIIWNPANKTTIEARGTRAGVGHFSYANGPNHRIFEIWRVGDLTGRH